MGPALPGNRLQHGVEGNEPWMSCPNCGSWAVKSDRSLGGRMVCGRCGQPLGGQVIPLRRRRGKRNGPFRMDTRRLWGLGLMALVALSGVLAALEPQGARQRPSAPPRRPLVQPAPLS
jgi:hypothetical protein